MSKPTLLIIGINGFLGSWVLDFAIKTNLFKIKGSMKDLNDLDKRHELSKAFGLHLKSIELFSLDLTKRDEIEQALEGVDYVFHGASIFSPFSDISEKELIQQTVNTTREFMEEIQSSQVKKLVFTSTASSMMDFSDGEKTYDESHWTDLSGPMTKYIKSKIRQEMVVWDYYNILSESEKKFNLYIINPGILMGPVLVKRKNSSLETGTTLINGNDASQCPQIYLGYVDVRDGAEAFFKIIYSPGGERFAITTTPIKLSQLGEIVHKNYSKFGYKVVHEDMGGFKMWFGSFFDKEVDYLYEIWNTKVTVLNSKSKNQLGLNYRPIENTMVDMCESLIEHKMVEDLRSK